MLELIIEYYHCAVVVVVVVVVGSCPSFLLFTKEYIVAWLPLPHAGGVHLFLRRGEGLCGCQTGLFSTSTFVS